VTFATRRETTADAVAIDDGWRLDRGGGPRQAPAPLA
jgi:hypothetical protein